MRRLSGSVAVDSSACSLSQPRSNVSSAAAVAGIVVATGLGTGRFVSIVDAAQLRRREHKLLKNVLHIVTIGGCFLAGIGVAQQNTALTAGGGTGEPGLSSEPCNNAVNWQAWPVVDASSDRTKAVRSWRLSSLQCKGSGRP